MEIELSKTFQKEITEMNSLANMQILNNEDNAKASIAIKGLRKLKVQVQETFRPHIKKANELWKGLLADEKKYIEPIERCEEIIETKMKQFLMAERQKQIEAQRKANELAEKEAQKERDRLAKQATKLEAKGKVEEAQSILQEAEMITSNAPIVQSRAEKQEGITEAEKYTFQIINEELIPREYLMPDMVKIRKYVNAMKKDAKIPGIKIEEDISIRVRP